MDNSAGTHKEYGFEEGVGANVKEGQVWLVDSDSNYYKAQLARGGECYDFFDVILCDRADGCE